MTTITALQEEISAWASRKGWDVEERPFAEWIALLHTEVSETYEEYRNGHDPQEIYFRDGAFGYDDHAKPEGIPIELGDLAVRLLHMCAHYGIDLEAAVQQKMVYNETRPHRHGGKRA